jgi:hypothetical protein
MVISCHCSPFILLVVLRNPSMINSNPENSKNIVSLTQLSDEALLEICKAAEVIACECPGYLARLLRQVRAFHHYTLNCIEQFPNDTETHLWLAERAQQTETLLYATMIELMQRENLLDDSQNLLLDKLSERARHIVMQQIGA